MRRVTTDPKEHWFRRLTSREERLVVKLWSLPPLPPAARDRTDGIWPSRSPQFTGLEWRMPARFPSVKTLSRRDDGPPAQVGLRGRGCAALRSSCVAASVARRHMPTEMANPHGDDRSIRPASGFGCSRSPRSTGAGQVPKRKKVWYVARNAHLLDAAWKTAAWAFRGGGYHKSAPAGQAVPVSQGRKCQPAG